MSAPWTWTSGALAAITCGALGCGSSSIASARLEGAIAPTFANLVHVQVSWLGLPPIATPDLGVTANCRTLAGATTGAGEWVCTLRWQGPDRQTLTDTYDLVVATDGCYMATIAGDSLGGPALKASDGNNVRNLLYAFEGCFDTT